ncbi:ribonuclease Z [Marinilabilia rubra]|uniref:Ribonuclease Z n=1 Tax=Marinilabilia rubra TaxID=2162893 RepID=A0A2U2B6I4_9BACT|nr:ribonuclease Z [Marinilabilia rubra]PWD98690.1 ribonuclease Z [Marinilabilia rubra]
MGFSVTVLGSNSALPTSERNPTAQVLEASGRFFLIDCGEGTQMQLRRNRVHFGRINHIFISHLHGDHVFGLPGLISTFGLLGRTKDLHIYAISDLEKLLTPLIDYFNRDLPFKVVYHPFIAERDELIYQDNLLEIKTIPLKHRVPTVGFLFREKCKLRKINKQACDFYDVPVKWLHRIKEGEDFVSENGTVIENMKLTLNPPPSVSYAFCTDTRVHDGLIRAVEGVDMLYHEATFLKDQTELAVRTFHSTAEQAARVANEANVGKLLLGHFSSRYRDLTPFLDEARDIFPNSFLAREGDSFDV